MDIKSKVNKIGELIVKYYWVFVIGFIISLITFSFVNSRIEQSKREGYYEYKNEDILERRDSLEKYRWQSNIGIITFNIYKDTNYLNVFDNEQGEIDKVGQSFKDREIFIGKNGFIEPKVNGALKQIYFLVYNTKTKKYMTNSNDASSYVEDPSTLGENIKNHLSSEQGNFSTVKLRDLDMDLYYKSDKEGKPVQFRHSGSVKSQGDYILYFWIPKEKFQANGYYGQLLNEEKKIQNIINTDENVRKVLIILISVLGLLNIYIGIRKNVFRAIAKAFQERKSIRFKFTLFACICLPMSGVVFLVALSFIESSIGLMAVLIILSTIVLFIILYTLYFGYRLQQIIDETSNINTPIGKRKNEERNLAQLIDNFENLRQVNSKAVNKMIENERLKAELVTNVSHDLKTPLTSIINYTDILLNKDISNEEKEDYLKILNNKSLKLKVLIEDLFEISKITSGKEKANLEEVDLIELLKQSLGELSAEIDKGGIQFNFNSNEENLIMNLDGKKISRVFENLISNITKYSLKGTRAYIDVEAKQEEVLMSFKNISRNKLTIKGDEIFNRFTRGDSSRSSKVEGNGLGLSIAKTIVELHNGEINISIDGDLFKVIVLLKK